ncbi:PREDICTED: uncharacterized protein LOC105567986 [Vollenhovia emeryi]|uniref:uncharacterized protein LOC105567986 n=1 Tax=Vollenhovia emeryi TaxID=411798 RepID=UPI0005F509CB|nr:PREDICTED: uncharacterized protein LOC105567986 [Vollenhovia emeryi]
MRPTCSCVSKCTNTKSATYDDSDLLGPAIPGSVVLASVKFLSRLLTLIILTTFSRFIANYLLSVIVVTAVRESSKKIVGVSLEQKNYGSAVHSIMIALDTNSANHGRTA